MSTSLQILAADANIIIIIIIIILKIERVKMHTFFFIPVKIKPCQRCSQSGYKTTGCFDVEDNNVNYQWCEHT
jgi:hypothetical protein